MPLTVVKVHEFVLRRLKRVHGTLVWPAADDAGCTAY